VVRGAGSTAWPHPAKVRLHARAELLADRLPPAAGLLQLDGEDACILETGSDSPYDLAAFLGGLEVPFAVLEPPELRQLLGDLAGRFRAAGDPEA
jgi:WYL domain